MARSFKLMKYYQDTFYDYPDWNIPKLNEWLCFGIRRGKIVGRIQEIDYHSKNYNFILNDDNEIVLYNTDHPYSYMMKKENIVADDFREMIKMNETVKDNYIKLHGSENLPHSKLNLEKLESLKNLQDQMIEIIRKDIPMAERVIHEEIQLVTKHFHKIDPAYYEHLCADMTMKRQDTGIAEVVDLETSFRNSRWAFNYKRDDYTDDNYKAAKNIIMNMFYGLNGMKKHSYKQMENGRLIKNSTLTKLIKERRCEIMAMLPITDITKLDWTKYKK